MGNKNKKNGNGKIIKKLKPNNDNHSPEVLSKINLLEDINILIREFSKIQNKKTKKLLMGLIKRLGNRD